MRMRILYGVCSDGLGHAMRARVLGDELRRAGHELLFAAFGRPAALLRRHGFEVLEVKGLTIAFEAGAIRRRRTVQRALSEAPSRIHHNLRAALNEVKAFAPDVTLTDFSGFACYAKLVTHCPVISIDHQHVIDRFHHPPEVTHGFWGNFAVARATVTAKTPGCDRFLVTSFYFPKPRAGTEGSTQLTGPLLRPELIGSTVSQGEHVLVYQTAAGDSALLETLQAVPDVPFRVYGAGTPMQRRNVELLAFDEAGFLEDLVSARAVVSNGGFSALSEAIYLAKPVLSIPVAHQGEQQLNAAWLSRLGLGMRGSRLTKDLLQSFLQHGRGAAPTRDPRLTTGTRDFTRELTRALAEVA
jgi:uncharacterized protein (TIGR00661 family)